MKTLGELAIIAWGQELKRQAELEIEKDVRKCQMATEQFTNIFGDDLEHFGKALEPGQQQLAFSIKNKSAFTLRWIYHSYEGPGDYISWHLVGRCPICGNTAISATIKNMVHLGELLSNPFEPAYRYHQCPPLQDPPEEHDQRDALIDALTAVLIDRGFHISV